MMYEETWQPFRSGAAGKPDKKTRPIRYGARGDACIYTYYRQILSEKYEKRLVELGITDCPIAYRKIPKNNLGGGKCNIDFAKDAFDTILEQQNCVAIALDISGFFENLDHSRIKAVWKELLEVTELPRDHYAVFKNITKYKFVNQKDVYRRLGFFGHDPKSGKRYEHYLVPFKEMPTQLCSMEEYRAKICGIDSKYKSLIHYNKKRRGVPQGAPLSDLIANFYMMDFDAELNRYAQKQGGKYMRYSDDIVLILPQSKKGIAEEACTFASDTIKRYGSSLVIKESKTCVVSFSTTPRGLVFRHESGPSGKNGFEYLGFRFDGKKVFIRDSTLAKLYRKATSSAKAASASHVAKNRGEEIEALIETFNYSAFYRRFYRVLKRELSNDYSKWTFYTYAKRAAATFGPVGTPIKRQIKGFHRTLENRITDFITKIYENL